MRWRCRYLSTLRVDPCCYVNDDATGSNNGNSWAEAYTSLQAALADSNCTEIWVAMGVYYPDNTRYADNARSATFTLKKGVEVYVGFNSTESTLNGGRGKSLCVHSWYQRFFWLLLRFRCAWLAP